MFMKQSDEEYAFDLFTFIDSEVMTKSSVYAAPACKVHEITAQAWAALSKIDDFMCLHQKCPFWLNPCF